MKKINIFKYLWYKSILWLNKNQSNDLYLKVMEYEISKSQGYIDLKNRSKPREDDPDIIFIPAFFGYYPKILFDPYYKWYLLRDWCKALNLKIEVKYNRNIGNEDTIFNLSFLLLIEDAPGSNDNKNSILFESKHYKVNQDGDVLEVFYENVIDLALIYLYQENGEKLYESEQ